jgi:hypothetical protein
MLLYLSDFFLIQETISLHQKRIIVGKKQLFGLSKRNAVTQFFLEQF